MEGGDEGGKAAAEIWRTARRLHKRKGRAHERAGEGMIGQSWEDESRFPNRGPEVAFPTTLRAMLQRGREVTLSGPSLGVWQAVLTLAQTHRDRGNKRSQSPRKQTEPEPENVRESKKATRKHSLLFVCIP
jgi:hypothetical protein